MTSLLEFGWEKNRTQETVHFLANPPPPLEWTDIFPNDRKLSMLRRVSKTKILKLKEIVFKTEKIYGFLSGI